MTGSPTSAALQPPVPLRRHRHFQAIIWSQTCTDSCEQFLIMAIVWAALHEFGSAKLGLVLAAWAVPRGLLLLFGGVLVDRSDRRNLTALIGCLLAALTTVAAVVTQHGALWAWLGVAVGLGVLDAVRLPVAASMLPSYLDPTQLIDANRWNGLREWGTLAGGPAVGGALVALLGTSRTLFVSAGLYAISAALMALVPRREAPPAEEERLSILGDLRGGLAYVVRHPRLRILLPAFALANLFILGLIAVAVPVFAKDVLHSGPQGLGALSASFGVGLVGGTMACGRLPARWRNSERHIFLLFMGSDLLLAAVGVMPSLVSACVVFMCSGLFAGPAATFYRTLMQTIPPQHYLGRVNSIARAASFGLEPVSVTAVGALSARISTIAILIGGGLAASAVDFIGSLLSPRHQPAEEEEPAPAIKKLIIDT